MMGVLRGRPGAFVIYGQLSPRAMALVGQHGRLFPEASVAPGKPVMDIQLHQKSHV